MKITESKFEPGIEMVLYSKPDNINTVRDVIGVKDSTILYASMDSCIYSVCENRYDSDSVIFAIEDITYSEINALKEWIECNAMDNIKEIGSTIIIAIRIDRDTYIDNELCELMEQIPTHFLFSAESKYFFGKALLDLEKDEIYPEWIRNIGDNK